MHTTEGLNLPAIQGDCISCYNFQTGSEAEIVLPLSGKECIVLFLAPSKFRAFLPSLLTAAQLVLSGKSLMPPVYSTEIERREGGEKEGKEGGRRRGRGRRREGRGERSGKEERRKEEGWMKGRRLKEEGTGARGRK